MTILGHTRSNKPVWVDLDATDQVYSTFTKDDHFDALCILAYRGQTSSSMAALLGHGSQAGLDSLAIVESLAGLILRGKNLTKERAINV